MGTGQVTACAMHTDSGRYEYLPSCHIFLELWKVLAILGRAVPHLVEALCYKMVGSGFDSR